MTRRRITLAFLFIALAVGAGACKKKVGSPCKPGESTCFSKTTALVCPSANFTEVACNGPLGCSKFQDHANCDTSIATEGAPCMGVGDEDYACTPDKKRALVCRNAKFARHLECRGKDGCSLLGQQLSCDMSVAEAKDPCKNQGATACSVDQKQMLTCRDGKFDVFRHCRGQSGCFFRDQLPACDETLSLEGDPCGMAGRVVCAVDGSAELVCSGGRYRRERACKRGCTVGTTPGRPIVCE